MRRIKTDFPLEIVMIFVLSCIVLVILYASGVLDGHFDRLYDKPDIKVTLYDHSGEKIRSWDGKIMVSDTVNVVRFVTDDETVVINGGIVVIEEV